MGTDKARLTMNGETLAARSARVLRQVCDPAIEVGSGVTDLESVREQTPGAGPLAALVAGVDALRTTGPVLLLACDLPFVEPPLLRLLADWPGVGTVVPVRDGVVQTACARYGIRSVDAARALLDGARGDERSLRRAITDADCEYLAESVWREVAPGHAFEDVDTPSDLVRLGLAPATPSPPDD